MEIIIIAAILLLVAFILISKSSRQKIVEICKSTADQTIRKNSNQQRILEYLKENEAITNTEARGLLKVSDRTIVRYMDELEKRGLVKQSDSTGRSVCYKAI